MRKLGLFSSTLVLLLASTASARQFEVSTNGHFGIGIMIGEPTAITAELLLKYNSAVDFALGVDTPGERDLYLHSDYLLMPFDIVADSPDVSIPFYIGLGGFLISAPSNDLFIGARVPVGVDFNFRRVPLQLFVELAVKVIVIEPSSGPRRADLDADVGVRVFF